VLLRWKTNTNEKTSKSFPFPMEFNEEQPVSMADLGASLSVTVMTAVRFFRKEQAAGRVASP
jgi:hypothetical protein